MNELLKAILLVGGVVFIFTVGFWLQGILSKPARAKFALNKIDAESFEESEKRELHQFTFDQRRFNGWIGTLHITEKELIVSFSTLSPAKLFWGLRTKGIIIHRSEISQVSKSLGVLAHGHTFSFTDEDHQAIQTHWNKQTEPVGTGQPM